MCFSLAVVILFADWIHRKYFPRASAETGQDDNTMELDTQKADAADATLADEEGEYDTIPDLPDVPTTDPKLEGEPDNKKTKLAGDDKL